MMLESVLPLSEVENQFEKLERLLEMHEDGQPCKPSVAGNFPCRGFARRNHACLPTLSRHIGSPSLVAAEVSNCGVSREPTPA